MKKKLIRLLACMLAMMLSTSSLLSVNAEESPGGDNISTLSEETEEPASYSKTIAFGIGQGISSIIPENKTYYNTYGSYTMVLGYQGEGITKGENDFCIRAQLAGSSSAVKRRSTLFDYGDSDNDGNADILAAGEYEITFWAKNVDAIKASYEEKVQDKDMRVLLSFHDNDVIDYYTYSSGKWEKLADT